MQIVSWHKLCEIHRIAVNFQKLFFLVADLKTEPRQEFTFVKLSNQLIVEEQLEQDTRLSIQEISSAARACQLLKINANHISNNIRKFLNKQKLTIHSNGGMQA